MDSKHEVHIKQKRKIVKMVNKFTWKLGKLCNKHGLCYPCILSNVIEMMIMFSIDTKDVSFEEMYDDIKLLQSLIEELFEKFDRNSTIARQWKQNRHDGKILAFHKSESKEHT